MPKATIYIFEEPRNSKTAAARFYPFVYQEPMELEEKLLTEIKPENVYHVTAFSEFDKLIVEIYKSQKQKTTK